MDHEQNGASDIRTRRSRTGLLICPLLHQSRQLNEPQDIGRLLSLAASSVSLLTLPQTDEPDDNLPQGEERSEQFVLEVSEYFERLDVRLSPPFSRVSWSIAVTIFFSTRLVCPGCHPFVARAHPTVPHRPLRDQRATPRVRTPIARRHHPHRHYECRDGGSQSRVTGREGRS